jgi:hypothetical protein
MSPERAKFYTEIMKVVSTFILGTSAGIFGIFMENKVADYYSFLWFIAIFDALSIGIFVALFFYIDTNLD